MFKCILFFSCLLAIGCNPADWPASNPTLPTLDDQGVYDIPSDGKDPEFLQTGLRHAYAHVQPWSRGGPYFLALDFESGEGRVIYTFHMTSIARLPYEGHRWIGDSSKILMVTEDIFEGATLYRYDMQQRAIDDPIYLGHPGVRVSRSHRDTSRNGQWVAIYIDKGRDRRARILTVDLDESEVVLDQTVRDFGCLEEPHWVGVDPTGTYLMVQGASGGDQRCQGLWAYDIVTGEPVRQITSHTHAGSFGLDASGTPYFMSVAEPFPDEEVFEVPTRYGLDGQPPKSIGRPVPNGSMEHVSCLGDPGDPCLVSAHPNAAKPFSGQLWWLHADGRQEFVGPHNAGGCHRWGDAHGVVGVAGQYAYATHDGDCQNIRSVLVGRY